MLHIYKWMIYFTSTKESQPFGAHKDHLHRLFCVRFKFLLCYIILIVGNIQFIGLVITERHTVHPVYPVYPLAKGPLLLSTTKMLSQNSILRVYMKPVLKQTKSGEEIRRTHLKKKKTSAETWKDYKAAWETIPVWKPP